MPSLKEYVKRKGALPKCITASFAFYIAFFSGHTLTDEGLIAEREGNTYTVKDDNEKEVKQVSYKITTEEKDIWKCLAKPQKRLKEGTIITFGKVTAGVANAARRKQAGAKST